MVTLPGKTWFPSSDFSFSGMASRIQYFAYHAQACMFHVGGDTGLAWKWEHEHENRTSLENNPLK